MATYETGKCPKCGGEMKRLGQKVDRKTGRYEAGYKKCKECEHRKQR